VSCSSIGYFFLGLFLLLWLINNPSGWYLVVFVALIIAVIMFAASKSRQSKSIIALAAMAKELRQIENEIPKLAGGFLALEPGEFAFYEKTGVQLREYKSPGRESSGAFGGVGIRVTKGISVGGGGYRGQSRAKPEELTVLDTGKAIFTNQRVIFVGPNHNREWELDKLLDLQIGDNGYEVSAAVSNRNRTSALASDASTGITPGVLFAIAVQLSKGDEQEAKRTAGDIAGQIESQYKSFNK
jgi:hypothetical protein